MVTMSTSAVSSTPVPCFDEADIECGVCKLNPKRFYTISPCQHKYCGLCLDIIFKSTKKCPECRNPFTTYKYDPTHSTLASKIARSLKITQENREVRRSQVDVKLQAEAVIYNPMTTPDVFGSLLSQQSDQRLGEATGFGLLGLDPIAAAFFS